MNLLFAILPALLLLGQGWGQQPMTSCPSGWLSWNSQYCYLFVDKTQVTWSQASDECTSNQAELLRIDTTDEYAFVKNVLPQFHSDAYWTALNDNPLNGQTQNGRKFMWGNDEYVNSDVVDAHWDKEPDNTDSDDCVHVSIQATLSVENCNVRHAYICEIYKNSADQCPANWTLGVSDTRCYFISNATDWSQTLNWTQARSKCQSTKFTINGVTRQGRLLSINSTDDQMFLESYLGVVVMTRQVYWTALNDIDREGQFVWADNNSPFNSSVIVWRVEPNNLAGMEHCGALIPGAEWSDRDCNDQLNYACRMELAIPGEVQSDFGCGTWIRAAQKCFYVYSTVKKNWQGARSFCQSMGGDLMKYENTDDMNWLNIQSASNLMELPGYWIGLIRRDPTKPGVFTWADGSSAKPELLNWDYEPNGLSLQRGGSMDQDCAVMAYNGRFVDRNCAMEKAATICEDPSGKCNQNWLTFNKHCYLFDYTLRTHDEAQGYCSKAAISNQGQLFALNSNDELQFLLGQLANIPKTAPDFYWSDLTDQIMENDWHWSNPADDDPVAIENLVVWSHEPNNWKGLENCVQVYYGGFLNDDNCDVQTGFVCERNPGSGASRTVTASIAIFLFVSLDVALNALT